MWVSTSDGKSNAILSGGTPPLNPCLLPQTACPCRSYSTFMEVTPTARVRLICHTPVYTPSSKMVPPLPPQGPCVSGPLMAALYELGYETILFMIAPSW